MKVRIPFNLIRVNQIGKRLEIVFPYGNDFYRLDWSKVPDRFKELYIVWLKLSGYKVQEWLKEFERDVVDVSDVSIEIELDECEKIPETYPL